MAYLLAGLCRSRRNECKIKQAAGGAYLPCGALLFGAAFLLDKPIKKRAGRSRVAARFAR